METNQKFCPGCPNACPIETLSCDKGRALHGLAPVEKQEPLIDKFMRCGKRCCDLDAQFIEYGLEEDLLLSCLNTEKQNQLSEILDLLEKHWKNF